MICSLRLKVRAAFPEKLVRKNTNMAILGCFGDFALVTQILIFLIREEATSSLGENLVNN